jgi:hypothetical protein
LRRLVVAGLQKSSALVARRAKGSPIGLPAGAAAPASDIAYTAALYDDITRFAVPQRNVEVEVRMR